MRQTLLFAAVLGLTGIAGGTALAADYFPPAPSGAYWTGAYIGVQTGYGWDSATFTAPGETVPAGSIDMTGWLWGARLGIDHQNGSMVLGAVADVSGTNIGASITDLGGGGSNVSAKVNLAGSMRARLGWVVSNNLMIYGTGGLAVAQVTSRVSNLDPGDLGSDTRTNTHAGWTAGIGAELALSNTMTFGLEWLYADYGTQAYHFDDGAGTLDANTHLTGNSVLASLNMRFR